nr:serine/threonine-protein kinase PITSLRE [Onthophagus taurus]
MSGGSGDEQREDGELRQSPISRRQKINTMEYSDEDGETIDSLDIKPPQASIPSQSRSKSRRELNERHHKRSERHKEDRHGHRQKHHRERKDREHREKERYYREKVNYENYGLEYVAYRASERKEEKMRHSDFRKYQEKKERDPHERYPEEKHRREKSMGDRTLQDLRERLLSKRGNKGEDEYKYERGESHRERKPKEYESLDSALQGEAGMYVKEIINISTEERRSKKDREEDKLTEEERAEQDMRREKLLEAEREMARQKEQSRIERERRHIEKQAKRKFEEETTLAKKQRVEEATVTVSDNSDEEYEDIEREIDDDEEEEEEEEVSERSRSRQRSTSVESNTNQSLSSHEERYVSDHHQSKSRSRSQSSEKDRNLSRSRSRTRSPSLDRNGKELAVDDKDDELLEEKKDETNDEEKKPKFDEDLPPYFPAIQGCRSVEEFQCLNKIEEGTYGVVYRARDKRTEEIVALKRLKMEKEKEGFPITSLREINTLLKGQHPNIVTVREIVVGSNMDKIFIVMDYVEHDLKSLMETMRHKKQTFTAGEVKCLLKQLLAAVAHLHDNWILHRDLKTSNLLLSHKGILKVGDFGLAREYGSPLKAYTPIVVTLWYRAPELLLCTKEYSTPIDIWSVGCIFAELLLMNAYFPGKSEVDQLNKVFKELGTPSEKIWPGFKQLPAVQKMKFAEFPVSNLRNRFSMLTELGLGLLCKFLTYDPVQRVTAEDALKHGYFNEAPLPIDPSMFPTWPAKSELGHRRAMAASPKPPSGGREYKQLRADGDDDGYGFRIGISAADSRRLAMGGGFSLKF